MSKNTRKKPKRPKDANQIAHGIMAQLIAKTEKSQNDSDNNSEAKPEGGENSREK